MFDQGFPLTPLDVFAGLLAAISSLVIFIVYPHQSSSLPLPPGPKPLPVIGNALQIPTRDPRSTYHKWRKVYGDIVHLTAAGEHIIILNSARAAFDLLEKRGKIYSDRPASVMVKMVGLDKTWVLLPYGDTLRQFRRLGRQSMGMHAIGEYKLVQEEEARFLAKAVIDSPNDLIDHIKRATSITLLRILYGYTPSNELDALNTAAQKLVSDSSILILASARLLDLFPFLRHIPAWFPFVSFQKRAKDLGNIFRYVFNTPFEAVKRNLDTAGEEYHPSSSICATLLYEGTNEQYFGPEGENLIRTFLGSIYPPGQETSASTLATFFMLMATHPQVQAKAKAEISSVVGDHRLPASSDRHLLVYLQALLKEILRWHSVVPLGLPHRSMAEDEYNGYRIPKNSIVFPNVWEMMHDPEVYPDPFSFRPERFLDAGGKTQSAPQPSPFTFVFGFGRRSCPGMYFAEASLLITMSTILATCQIEQCCDSTGLEIHIEPEFTPTLVTHLLPYKCSVKPKSQHAMNLLRHALDDARAS
ncbi:cytochrome P450 [Ramaria rubella]|nr:cytochrome P450 [Ramaria rubella]